MFDCEEYSNVLGEKQVRITISGEDWKRLLETGFWDKVVEVLTNESKPFEKEKGNRIIEALHRQEAKKE